MKILDIKTNLSTNSFLYELITSAGKYYINILFGIEDDETLITILIYKNLFDSTKRKIEIDPVEFSTTLKNSTYEDGMVDSIINIIDDLYLSEHREREIDKLI